MKLTRPTGNPIRHLYPYHRMMSGNAQHPLAGRIGRFVSYLGGNNPTVFSIVIVAALLLVVARILAPFEVGKDQASQLEAGQRLFAGLGLTTTNDVTPVSHDIVEAPNARYLTWWPPGFSVLVAAFLSVGLPLLASLKILYALTTLAGWLGWATLISHFVTRGIKIGARTYPVHLLAFVIPIFFTPKWSGTDVFLWAGVPIMILLLFKSGHARSLKASLVYVGMAGLLFGSLYAIRYASLFMGVAAGLVLLQITLPYRKTLIMRCAVFGLTAALIIVPVTLYAKTYSQHSSVVPAYVMKWRPGTAFGDTARAFLFRLPTTAHLIFGIPLPDQIVYRVNSRWLTRLVGISCLTVILLLPFILWKSTLRSRWRLRDDTAFSLSLLPISLVGSITMANVYFLGVRRYYEPIALCGVLIAYEIASRRMVQTWVRAASLAILLMFAAYTLIFMPALAFSPVRSSYLVNSVLGFIPSKSTLFSSTSKDLSYPAPDKMFSQKESSRLKLLELHEANPHALFFVEEYGFFIYDRFQHGGPELGTDVRVYPRAGFWERAYTSKPVKIFWVVNEGTQLNFVPPGNLRLIHTDPYEKTKILESQFSEGYKFFSGDLAKPVQQITSPTHGSPAEESSREPEPKSSGSTNSNYRGAATGAKGALATG